VTAPCTGGTIRDMHSVRQPRLMVVHLVEELRYKTEGRGLDSRWGHWDFSIEYGLGVDLASNRNEHHGYLMGVKAAGA